MRLYSTTVSGIQLAYTDMGAGRPLVLLHGFPHDHTLWSAQQTALRERARVVAPDLRGFGASDAAPPYTMQQYADDVVALLDQLGIERAVLGGLSMGGYVAFAAWRHHRDRIQGLILADTRAAADSDGVRERRLALIALAEQEGAEAVALEQLPGLLGATTREQRPEVVTRARTMVTHAAGVAGTVGALEAMLARPDSTDLLSTIDVPVLLIAGAEDAISPEKEMRAMSVLLPKSTLEVIPEAGHLSCIEQPEHVTTAMERFLGTLG